MSEILQSTNDIPFADFILQAGAPLESILYTEELQRGLRVRPIMKKRIARWWH